MATGFYQRPKGLFGRPQQGTPGINPAANGPFGTGTPQMGSAAPQMAAEPRRGLFGRLGIDPAQLAALGATLQGDTGAVSDYFASQGKTLAQQAQQKAARDEWVWRQQYEQDHRAPVNNDTAADYEFWQQHLSPEQFETWKQNRVDPPQYRQGPDGQFYRVQTQQAPPDTLPADFDFGGGASTPGAPPFAGNTLDHITMMAESGGDPNAVSPKGARGAMQVMPATARDPGFGVRPSNGSQQDDVRLGQEYRAAMQRRYGGDPAKMWAAYNAGPGRVDEAIQRLGPNWLQAMPAETRAYIAQNLRALGTN